MNRGKAVPASAEYYHHINVSTVGKGVKAMVNSFKADIPRIQLQQNRTSQFRLMGFISESIERAVFGLFQLCTHWLWLHDFGWEGKERKEECGRMQNAGDKQGRGEEEGGRLKKKNKATPAKRP